MNVKRFVVLLVCVALTAGLVIVGVIAYRVQQAASDPVSVFFGDEVVIPEAEAVEEGPVIRQVDLVMNEKSYVKRDNILTIAVLGRDATPKNVFGVSRQYDGGNTDIMILMAIDLESGEVRALSLPRDTIAHIYHYHDTEDVIENDYFHKLNGAYGAGPAKLDDIQIRNSITCIQEHINVFGTFDVTIDNYVEIGLTGLMNLTDRVGGVEVTLANGIPGVGSAGQKVTLTGLTAMTFVRDRLNSGGDLGRVSNSQIYIKALARKLQSMGAAEMVPKLASSLLSDNLMRTDLKVEEIAALAGLLSDINIDGISMRTVATVEQSDIYGFKRYLEGYDYDYEAFYGASKWRSLDIREGEGGDFGFFTEYEDLEDIILSMYYEEVVFE